MSNLQNKELFEKKLTYVCVCCMGVCVLYSFDAAHSLANDKGCKSVCVLNMANQRRPGGGYRNGAGAQVNFSCFLCFFFCFNDKSVLTKKQNV